MLRSASIAAFIAVAVQLFTVGILAPRLPREVCRPGIEADRVFTLAATPVFRLVNVDGAVRVVSDEGSSDILVTARVRAYPIGVDGMALADAYIAGMFKVDGTDDLTELITEPGVRPDAIDLRVDYTVTVPPGTDVSVDVSNGNVRMAEGLGNVAVEGNNSDIEVIGAAGAVSVKTINGRIRALECAAYTTLETVNGSIVATLSGGAIQASTVTGSISATLMDGAIEVCDLTSLNGSITLVMSERHSAEVHASTSRGLVRAELPIEPRQGVVTRRTLHGSLGAGDTKVSMNSMNGDIVIQRSVT